MSESNFWRQNFTGNNISGDARVHFGNVHGDIYHHEYAALPPPQPRPSLVLGYPRDKNFVGRQHILEKLESELLSEQGHRRMALTGLGGIGKSQIAVEFCYRYHHKHNDHWVFWISASSRDRFLEGFAEMCTAMTGEEKFMSQPGILSTGKRLLDDSSKGHWLLVIDNADDRGILFDNDPQMVDAFPLAAYIPSAPHGKVLISSRNSAGMEFAGHPDRVVGVPPFSSPEGVELLAHRLKSHTAISVEAKELIERLDRIPLAIAQAAACINRNRFWSVRDYLDLFKLEANQTRLLGGEEEWHEMSREHGLPNAVFTTWRISFEQINKSMPLAADLLSFMSVLDRECMPDSLLICHDSGSGSSEENKLWYKSALGTLTEYSFITACPTDYGSFRWRLVKMFSPKIHTPGWSMHRLIQVCTRDWLRQQSDTILSELKERATMYLAAIFPRIEDSWADPQMMQDATIESLLPHLRVAAHYGTNRSLKVHILHAQIRLFDCLGLQERDEGDWSLAVPWLERAHHFSEEVFGSNHPDTILRNRRLSNIYILTERRKEALELITDVVKVYDVMYGPDSEVSSEARYEMALVKKAVGVKTEEPPLSREQMRQLDASSADVPIPLLLRAETRAMACMAMFPEQDALAEAEDLLKMVAQSFQAKLNYAHRAYHTLCLLSSVYVKQLRLGDAESLIEDTLLPFCKYSHGSPHQKSITLASRLVEVKWALCDQEGARLILREITEMVNSNPSQLGKHQKWIQKIEDHFSTTAALGRHLNAEQKKQAQTEMRRLWANPKFRQWQMHSPEFQRLVKSLEALGEYNDGM